MVDNETGHVLIESFEPDTSGGLLKKLTQRFSREEPGPLCELLIVEKTRDDTPNIRIIRNLKAEAKTAKKQASSFYRVITESMPMDATIEDLTSCNGFSTRLRVSGCWTVADTPRFLAQHGLSKVAPSRPLPASDFQFSMLTAVKGSIADEVSKLDFTDLRDRDALPTTWIEQRMRKVCDDCGIVLRLSGVAWESEAAELAASQEKDLEAASHTVAMEEVKAQEEKQRSKQILHQVAVKKAHVDLEREAADIRKANAETVLLTTEARVQEMLTTDKLQTSEIEREHLKEKMQAEKAYFEEQTAAAREFREKSAMEQEFMAEVKGLFLGMAKQQAEQTERQTVQQDAQMAEKEELSLSVCWRAFEAPESWQEGVPLKIKKESLALCEDLSSGESLQAFVETNHDAYIYLLTVGPYLEGDDVQYKWFRLFSNNATDDLGYPLSRHGGNLLRAGERLCLPAGVVTTDAAPEARVWTLDSNSDAVETFYVLASRERIPDNIIQDLLAPVSTRGIRAYAEQATSNSTTASINAGDLFRKRISQRLGPNVKVSEHRFFHFNETI